jgi:ABC-2 type transport system ATP-binding protein
VAILHQGKILLAAPMDQLKESHRRVTLRFHSSLDRPPQLACAIRAEGRDAEWTYVCRSDQESWRFEADALGADVVEETSMSLDEIFVSQVAG